MFSRNLCFTLLFCLLSCFSYSQNSFQRLIGGSSQERGQTLFETRSNRYLYNGATLTYGSGSADAFFALTDNQGILVWAKAYGTTFYDNSEFSLLASDHGFLGIGRTFYPLGSNSDALIFKTDSSGALLWSKVYGGVSNEILVHATETSDHGLALVGGTQSIGAGSDDILFIRTDANGDTIFTRSYGTAVSEFGTSIVQASDGSFFISGKQTVIRNGFPYADGILMRTDSMGNLIWSKLYGDSLWEELETLKLLSNDDLIACGSTVTYGAGSYDILAVRTDSSGTLQWAKTYGGLQSDASYGVLVNSDSSFVISGYTNSFGYGHQARTSSGNPNPKPIAFNSLLQPVVPFGDDSTNIILMKIDAAGDTIWTRTYGDGLQDEAYRNEKASDGGYLINGLTVNYAFADSAQMMFIKTDSLGFTGCHELSSHPQIGIASMPVVPAVFSVSSGMNVATVPFTEVNANPDDQDACLYLSLPGNQDESVMSLFPNPFSGELNIEVNGNFEMKQFVVTDVTGKILMSEFYSRKSSDHLISLDLSFLNSGIYFIRMIDQNVNSKVFRLAKI